MTELFPAGDSSLSWASRRVSWAFGDLHLGPLGKLITKAALLPSVRQAVWWAAAWLPCSLVGRHLLVTGATGLM